MENVSLGTKGDCFEQELVRVIPVDSVICSEICSDAYSKQSYVICLKPR